MNKTKLQHIWQEIWDTIKSLIPVIIIVILVRVFIAQPFIVSGESMYPTFHNKDYLIVDELSYRFSEPKRGDVIVLKYPLDMKRYFIKRIIGKPGETITFKNGKVYITEPNKSTYELGEPYYTGLTMPGNDTVITIPADQYFVMGDNRDFSSDSRIWGFLPKKNIVGRALLRLWPLSDIATMPGSINTITE